MSGPFTDVGVDLDGVVYPFADAFRNWWSVRTGRTDLCRPTRWTFHRDWGISDAEFAGLLEECAHDRVFAVLPPEPGTKEAWDELRSAGRRVHVVTHRPHTAWSQTALWLDLHGLVADSLTFTGDKTVVKHLAGGGRTAMVEDHTGHHDRLVAVGVHAVMVHRPWNDGHPGHRIRSFAEFPTHLRSLEATR